MSRTVSPSTRRRYGLALVCRAWEVNRSTVYAVRTRTTSPPPERGKRGPKTELSDDQLTELIRETITTSPWLGEGYRKVWVQVRAKGIRVCKRRVLRLMRMANLLSPSRTFKLALVKPPDGRITTDRRTRCGAPIRPAPSLARAMHASSSRLTTAATSAWASTRLGGAPATKHWSRFVRAYAPSSAATAKTSRSDSRSATTTAASSCQTTTRRNWSSWGSNRVRPASGSRRATEGAERFIRTLKEQLLWVRYFATIEDLRIALLEFKEKYNRLWLLERHRYRTPAQVRAVFEAEAGA